MAYQKILGQGTRALQVIPSDLCDIPYPGNHIVTSTNDAAAALSAGPPAYATLKDTTQDFIALGVEIGDIVYERGGTPGDTGAGTVLEVIDPNGLKVSRDNDLAAAYQPNFSAAAGIPYSIYKKGDYPCMLYFGLYGKLFTISVETAGGTILGAIDSIPLGNFQLGPNYPFPCQVRKVMYNNTGIPFVASMGAGSAPYLSCIAVW